MFDIVVGMKWMFVSSCVGNIIGSVIIGVNGCYIEFNFCVGCLWLGIVGVVVYVVKIIIEYINLCLNLSVIDVFGVGVIYNVDNYWNGNYIMCFCLFSKVFGVFFDDLYLLN